jgi:putative glutamine amidotransferase
MAQRAARRPLIGLTAGATEMMSGAWAGHRSVVLTEHYVEALRLAGARPVVIAPQDAWTAEEIAELDGLVLTGGADLDPASYGAEAKATDLPSDPERDAFETALYRAAREAAVPVLGICRGLQIIAVAEGGDLVQHLPEDVPEHPACNQAPTMVDVTITPDSDLALALGTGAQVTAFHHQAVRTVPAGLRPVAQHASGVVLGLEATEGSPVLAVQWHPELDHVGAGDSGHVELFESLVETTAAAGAARGVAVSGPVPAEADPASASAGLR